MYLWDFLVVQCLTYFHGFTHLKFQQQRQKPVLQVNIFTLWMSEFLLDIKLCKGTKGSYSTSSPHMPLKNSRYGKKSHGNLSPSCSGQLQLHFPVRAATCLIIGSGDPKKNIQTLACKFQRWSCVSYLYYHSHILQCLGAGKAEELGKSSSSHLHVKLPAETNRERNNF